MTTWSAHDGAPLTVPEPPDTFYGPVGDWQGAAYERNAFTQGTEPEVAFLTATLELSTGMTVLDVGCGTGRHCRALGTTGVRCVGVDLSHGLLTAAAARGAGDWIQGDARRLPVRDGCADVVLSLCQGGFGITPGGDRQVLAEMVRALRPGGSLVLAAFSLAFAARWMAPGDALDVGRGLHYCSAEVRGPDGAARTFDLWTQCYDVAQLRMMAAGAGLVVEGVYGVEPGRFERKAPGLRDPELLLLAAKPHLAAGTNRGIVG